MYKGEVFMHILFLSQPFQSGKIMHIANAFIVYFVHLELKVKYIDWLTCY